MQANRHSFDKCIDKDGYFECSFKLLSVKGLKSQASSIDNSFMTQGPNTAREINAQINNLVNIQSTTVTSSKAFTLNIDGTLDQTDMSVVEEGQRNNSILTLRAPRVNP